MIFLAIRYLLARRRQTTLTLLGIFFGSAAYVTISGFMLGFREYLVDQLINNSANVHIQAREDFIEDHTLDESFYDKIYKHVFWVSPPSGRKGSTIVENPQSWYERLKNDPRVSSYSPQLKASVIFSNGKSSTPATLTGCDPLSQTKITTIGEYMVEGKFSDIAGGGNRIVIGDELRRKLGVRVSQNILVSSSAGRAYPFKVVGIYKTGNRLGDIAAYGSLGDVQRVNGTLNQVNEIGVRLYDHTLSAEIATTWSEVSGEKVESWDQQNASLFDVFRVQDMVRYMSIGAILIVAGFGIYNVLNMTVIQKRRDIAILQSMGYSPGDIVWLFFSQGLILGISGAVLGLIFGYFFCIYLQTLSFSGGPMSSGSGKMMVSLNPFIYVQAATVAISSSLIASLLPARAAGKMTPIGIIREGAE